MDIAEKRWRREREEFMHPRYTRACKVWFFKTFQGGEQSPGIGESIFAAEVVSKGRKFKSLLSIFATPEMHF